MEHRQTVQQRICIDTGQFAPTSQLCGQSGRPADAFSAAANSRQDTCFQLDLGTADKKRLDGFAIDQLAMLLIDRPPHPHELVRCVRGHLGKFCHVRRPVEVDADGLARGCLHRDSHCLPRRYLPLKIAFRADFAVVEPSDRPGIGHHPALTFPLLGTVNVAEHERVAVSLEQCPDSELVVESGHRHAVLRLATVDGAVGNADRTDAV